MQHDDIYYTVCEPCLQGTSLTMASQSPESRLICYKDTVYKVRTTYNKECHPDLVKYRSELDAVLRVLIQAQGSVELSKIQTEHFLVDCAMSRWALCGKVAFLRNSRQLKLCRNTFELDVKLKVTPSSNRGTASETQQQSLSVSEGADQANVRVSRKRKNDAIPSDSRTSRSEQQDEGLPRSKRPKPKLLAIIDDSDVHSPVHQLPRFTRSSSQSEQRHLLASGKSRQSPRNKSHNSSNVGGHWTVHLRGSRKTDQTPKQAGKSVPKMAQVTHKSSGDRQKKKSQSGNRESTRLKQLTNMDKSAPTNSTINTRLRDREQVVSTRSGRSHGRFSSPPKGVSNKKNQRNSASTSDVKKTTLVIVVPSRGQQTVREVSGYCRDKVTIQQEELQEEMKLQQLSKADSDMPPSEPRSSQQPPGPPSHRRVSPRKASQEKRRTSNSVMETIIETFVTPVKKLFRSNSK